MTTIHVVVFEEIMLNVALLFAVVTTVIRIVRWVLDILP